MKISRDAHIKYMQTTYTDKEIARIGKFFDEKIMPDVAKKDSDIWYNLVYWFLNIPDGKKTKAFVYQCMAVNGIIDDSLNSKQYNKFYCEKVGECNIAKRVLKKLGRKWQDDDFNNICSNLLICFALPSPELMFTNYPDKITEFELDDRILKIRSKK